MSISGDKGFNSDSKESLMVNNTEQDVVEASLEKMESMISSQSKRCIYTVPEHIRKGKEECYCPLVISIGPVFYKDGKLEAMQELKRIFMKSFKENPYNVSGSLKPCIQFVRERENEIRECYEAQIRLARDEFIEMIVLDAAFLIYYCFLSANGGFFVDPPIGAKLELLECYAPRDLLLEENQLPFFVLKGMYEIAFSEFSTRTPFIEVALGFVRTLCASVTAFPAHDNISIDDDPSQVTHLVHLVRAYCCLPFRDRHPPICRDEDPSFQKFGSAKQLSAAGIKFKVNQSDNPFDIRFDKKRGVLEIPRFTLYDGTDSAIRSILFYEQCHGYGYKYVTDYFIFLDKLVDSVDDIQLLEQNEILQNHFGSDEEAVDLLNKLSKYIFPSPNFTHWQASRDLKEYTSKPWNQWKAILWSKYFSHPWAIISLIYAVILLILTILQTITGFLQLHK